MPHLQQVWNSLTFCFQGWLRSIGLLPAIFCLVGGVCAAQTGTPTIRITTRLVAVDVVVQDASGHTVTGLTAKDFLLKENGREQRLAVFTDQTGLPTTSPIASGKAKQYQFSNVPQAARTGAIALILFDRLNTPTQEQPFARKELLRFFRRLPAGTRCGLFVLDSRVRLVENVTTKRDDLIAAVDRLMVQPANLVHGEDDRQMTADQTAREQSAMGREPALGRNAPGSNAQLREEVNSYRERAGDTEEALATLTQAAAGYPGRKNLIWIAGSFPIGIGFSLQSDTATQLPRSLELPGVRDSTVAMAGAEIAIYPVSTRGMTSTSVGAEVSHEAETDRGGRGSLQTIAGQASRQFDLQVAMEHLASLTGGHAFYNTNDLASALEQSVNEGGRYYRLDFSPENQKWNGAYRHLVISVRGRGYHLAYRHGYFATSEAHPEAAQTSGLRSMVRLSPLQSSGIGLRANVLKPRVQGGDTAVEVAIDAASVSFMSGTDGLHHAKLLVLLVAESAASGAAPTEKQAVLNVGLEAADYKAVLVSGITVRQTIGGVLPGTTLRLGVRDLETGQIGTLQLQ